MAKYIGTYANSGAVQTALNELELQRPFIAYTTDNDSVIFGAAGDRAEVGDIVVYSTGDTLLHYIKQADYSASTYPVADYVPVGVVALPQADDVFSGASGEITFIGLKWLDIQNPDTGTLQEKGGVAWGYNNFVIPELTNYANSGTAIADMNGKANTEAVLQYATAQTNWKTDSAITWTNAAGYYPLFECAWRYHTSGTVQGDWYIPAAGQIYYLKNTEVLQKVTSALTTVGGFTLKFNDSRIDIFSSTQSNASDAFHNSGLRNILEKRGKYFAQYGFPFCSKLMTRLK